MKDPKKFLQKLSDFIKDKDFTSYSNVNTIYDEDIILKYSLSSLSSSKNILGSINLSLPKRKGLLGYMKNFIEKIVRNIVLNVVEGVFVKQSKFNQATLTSIEVLINKVNNLQKQLNELKNSKRV